MTFIEIPLTPEQQDTMFLKMISDGSLFVDETYPDAISPLTMLDILYREQFRMDVSHIRNAVPADIPKIREFYHYMDLIAEGIAE